MLKQSLFYLIENISKEYVQGKKIAIFVFGRLSRRSEIKPG